MTLFTTLLVLIFERLFKLGEHWQLDHRLVSRANQHTLRDDPIVRLCYNTTLYMTRTGLKHQSNGTGCKNGYFPHQSRRYCHQNF